ncbi:amino acid ABC transporter [Agaricicola taiwanensis]|uniref:Amino acid ABC transporter n=1 Tax=Agaricicola taiwanensis TaxID=591372 RepID=A0A8J3E079_9RHOB|nr:amino acid ABC transporter permease [Agaricicola taiwanensis]GGE53590.1 amino acid ABC transporter [Agaricicola taiwanensis]
MQFSFEFVLETLPALIAAAGVTIRVAAITIALSLFFGTVLTIVRALKIRPVNVAISIYISFIRGTPLLVQIFLAYYALPALGIRLGPVTAGVLAITANNAAFMTEIFRGALASIPPGQIEAAASLGLKPRAIWLKVVLPQLYMRSLPAIVNECTIVIKGTALLAVITVVEVFRTAQQIGSSSFRPFETFVAAGIVFLGLCLIISQFGLWLERRFALRRGT